MKRIAMIVNGIVENIALWDGDDAWHPGNQYTLIDVTDLPCNPGDIYINGNFQAP